MFLKVVAIAAVFLGEAFSIAAELIAAKRIAANTGDFLGVFILMFFLVTLGGALLVLGYIYGYLHLKNIWIIAAISVGSILIVEPIMAVILFKQFPTLGSAIGLGLGALGIFFALAF